MPERMTKKEYWDSVYSEKKRDGFKMPKFLKTVCYSERVLWNGIFQKYLPKIPGLKILEIGSAPGGNLIKFHQRFGYEPYGVEYSKKGVEINRRKFRAVGINPDNVIFSDFLSDEFQSKYKEAFDVVISRGVLEHFLKPEKIIKAHINLLVKKGYLIIVIPNLRGINRFLQSLFNKKVVSLHNLEIMDQEKFRGLFPEDRLEVLHCGYFGTFNFGLFRDRWRIFDLLQWKLNLFLYLLLGNRGVEGKFTSPYLIYIGKKK